MRLALFVARWSKDPSIKTGAVIVRPDRTIASVGYNGFPRDMRDAGTLYSDRGEKYSRIVHCEVNALLNSYERVDGYTLYTVPFASCDRCAVQMIQAGIARFVFPKASDDVESRWGDSIKRTKRYILEARKTFLEVVE